MNINIKLLPGGQIPRKAHPTDAAYDLVAASVDYLNEYVEYNTHCIVAIPEGYCGLVYPRSSISNKNMILCNSVGVIDASYRGAIKVRFYRRGGDFYLPGDRVAQLMIVPTLQVEFNQVTELDVTDRGDGGFGSSGT
jgi:dUTP pyrophosphatase